MCACEVGVSNARSSGEASLPADPDSREAWESGDVDSRNARESGDVDSRNARESGDVSSEALMNRPAESQARTRPAPWSTADSRIAWWSGAADSRIAR